MDGGSSATPQHITPRSCITLLKECPEKHKSNSMPVRDNDGVLLSKEGENLNRWKKDFLEVLNGPIKETGPESSEDVEELSINCGIISNTVKKASGGDKIPPLRF